MSIMKKSDLLNYCCIFELKICLCNKFIITTSMIIKYYCIGTKYVSI